MTPSRPNQPARLTRKPVITSSLMNSAPFARHSSASPALKPGSGGTTPMLPGGGLGDDAGDLAVVHPERLGHRVEVVVRQDDGVGRAGTGDARGVRQAEGRDAGPGRGEQRVDVAVVAAGELHDLGAAGEAAGQPDRGHRRLGAAGHQPQLLDRRDPVDDLLGERDLALGRRTERRALRHRGVHGLDDRRVGVAEHQRPPRADQVDVLAAVGVDDVRAVPADHEPRRAADGAERAHRRVDPAGRDGLGALHQRSRLRCVVRVGAHARSSPSSRAASTAQ